MDGREVGGRTMGNKRTVVLGISRRVRRRRETPEEGTEVAQ